MKTTESIRIQNQNFVESFLRRKGLITFTELFIFILIGISLCLTSCSPVLYSTVGQNVPLFHQKGEVAFGACYAITNYSYGGGVQFAAAVDSSSVIMSSYYSLKGGASSENYFELGAGKFKYNPTTKLCGELIIGMGFGSIKNSIYSSRNASNSTVSSNYIKPFVQPSFGVSTKIIDIAFTPRIAFVSYTSNSNNFTDPQMRSNLDTYYSSKKNTFVFEPGVTLRAGYKNVKLQLQYNHTSFNYASVNSFNPVDKDFFSLGFHILISNRWSSHSPK